ncbi:MAG: pilus assembly protein [Vallitalea sp.]|jgi:hypothetical protein|nr:pilus assembly protein [Vallitalea sp.]
MKKLKGSLTVEASIVLPIFIMAILSITYFIKIIYIQENIQNAINETANEMSTYAYILDKANILDTQQQIYEDSISQVNENNSNIQNIINNLETLYNTIENANSIYISNQIAQSSSYEKMKSSNNLPDFIDNYIKNIKHIKDEIMNNATTAYKSLNEIMGSINIVIKNFKNTIIKESFANGIDITNNYLGTKMAEIIMDKHITKEQYKNWYIVNGKDGMDFRQSRFMLDNEDIDLIVKYKIAIPIPFPGLKEISMIQRVKVRGWTGNRDSQKVNNTDNENNNNDKDPHIDKDTIVYLVKNRSVYHLDETCVKKNKKEITYKDIKYDLDPCDLCCKESNSYEELRLVYYTEYGEVFHIEEKCKKIYSETERTTIEEAIKRGRRQCKAIRCREKKKRIEDK